MRGIALLGAFAAQEAEAYKRVSAASLFWDQDAMELGSHARVHAGASCTHVVAADTEVVLQAIAGATKGHVVCISPGTVTLPTMPSLNEGVVLSSELADSPAVIQSPAAPEWTYATDDVVFRDLVLDGVSLRLEGSGAVIAGCQVENVVVDSATNVKIQRNLVKGRVVVLARRAALDAVVITGNTVEGAAVAVATTAAPATTTTAATTTAATTTTTTTASRRRASRPRRKWRPSVGG
mmetsp:Transcript_31037/g.70681  ORF Transcript_31037/g.70681 Transcript_31037/m.70681 type:complete len:237 (+) Transcript_31037:79-789(+)